MGTPSSVFLGTRPPIYTMKFAQWLITLAKFRLCECPLVRKTRVYCNYSAAGSSAGGGGAGTLGSPYLCATPAHIDTLIRSLAGTNGDLRFSLRHGDVWTAPNGGTGIVLDVPNVTLDSYSDGTTGHTLADPMPYLSGFMAAYGGSGWTQDGAVYWRAETNGLGWFREAIDPDMCSRRLTTATTLANFKSLTNAGSWVLDTTQAYGYGSGGTNKLVVNPRTSGAAPLTTSQVSVGVGCGVRVTKDGVRVHNIWADGWGQTAGDDAQQYSFRSDVQGQDCCVFSNCKGYYCGKFHCAGHLLAGTGGITSFFNCSFGLCQEISGAATMLNFYSDNGSSEGLSWCNNITHGCLFDETYNSSLGQAIYSHTASSVPYGQLVVYGTKGPAVGCKNGIFGGSSSGSPAVPANRDDEATINTFFVNEDYPEIYITNGGGEYIDGPWARINSKYRYNIYGAMSFIGIQLANPTAGAGFEINTTKILDATKTTATAWYFTFTNRNAVYPFEMTKWHSRIEVKMNPTNQYSDEGNGAGVNRDTLINCVYSGSGTGIFALNGFLNQLPSLTQRGCTGLIIGGMRGTASSYNGTKNYIEVSQAEALASPSVASASAYQNAVGTHPQGWLLEYDETWKARTKLQSSAGPRNMGYTSESLLSLMTP